MHTRGIRNQYVLRLQIDDQHTIGQETQSVLKRGIHQLGLMLQAVDVGIVDLPSALLEEEQHEDGYNNLQGQGA